MRTISAISTPHGVGAVSMIRLSGDDAIEIAERVFRPVGGKPLSHHSARQSVYGVFHDGDGDFDDGLATVFVAPNSYTGENVVELMCHGGVLGTRRLLAATFRAGATPAAAGEYTKRAFINGKLSLSQAEAVGALIEAKTDACLGVGIRQLGGALTKKINLCFEKLLRLTSSVYAYIDYPEEDMTDMSADELKAELGTLKATLAALKDSYRYGKAISEGVSCAIVGCPNVGKSSVLNMLIGEERAIVTPIAGTTRDVVTETVRLGDILLRLSDTAGIREGGGEIERIGIERSIKSLEGAELVLAVFDGSKKQSDADGEVIRHIEEKGKTALTVGLINKSDKGRGFTYDTPFPQITLSAKTGEGMEELKKAVGALYASTEDLGMGETVINARQYSAVCRALSAVENALFALESGFTQDVAGFDMEEAMGALAELDGRSVSEEIVNDIFSRFCVGK
ncbi:MAG: tRNA uridine-5-carboxymethylaminomethyl(34) synthesis GTPase MnmE [Clostridia bacterium]|nr:tRNA uridine-5-carboxymethylaminomethyl(34) synthesis GTPase MnmE [Clostridia bacterium]